MRSIFSLIFVALTVVACGKQSPVGVVDGYNQKRVVYTNDKPVNAVDRAFDMQSEAILGFKEEEKYYVHGGDKLEQIAKHFGVSEKAILLRNNILSENEIPVGGYITIPSPNWQAANIPNDISSSYRLTDKYSKEISEVSDDVVVPVAIFENEKAIENSVRKINLMRQHTLRSGENIYRVALKYNVSQFDILAANNIRNPADLKPGMILNIPQAGDVVTGRDEYRYLANKTPVQAGVLKMNDSVVQSTSSVRKMQVNDNLKNSNFSSKNTTVIQANAEKNYYESLALKYRKNISTAKGMVWPANGRIIKTFGSKGPGVSHSGINISLPKDAPVYAADSGTVIYADNGLEVYGNLVLIQHKNGYVTAYAHNSKNIVKRHSKIGKGQLIGFAGNTGNVENTQLHFEVRKNAQAINPIKVLPRR